MIRKAAVTIATALAAGGLALAAALPAAAGISHTKVITPNGEAGYQAGMNGPGRFKAVQAQFTLRNEAKGLGSTGGTGVQLCNDTTGNAVQLGARWNAGENAFDILVGSGTLTAHPGTDTTPCNSGGAFAGSDLSPALDVPAGNTVLLILQEVSPGVYEAFAKDVTLGTSASKSFAGLTFPDEAGVGVVQNLTTLSAPLALRLASFTDVRLTGQKCGTHNLGGTSCWTAVQAYSTANGMSSDPPLVDPQSSLHGRNFHVEIGSETGA
ncbi:MAG TPA: hypothetical protein VIX86_11380 [Streptosporangiaceae bacterium]